MKVLIRFLVIIFLSAYMCSLNAQFGLRLKFNNQTFNNWDKSVSVLENADSRLFNYGYEAGLDYWFRLKKRRVEFMPEISYSISSSSFSTISGIDNIGLSTINFNFNTHIYALDMEGDCDCPTFSKQGASINKGLFFHFTPGLGYYNSKTQLSEGNTVAFDEAKGLVFRAGLGLGLDLGLSDLLTITPIVSYYFHSNMQWDNMPSSGEMISASDNPKQIQLTVRLGFRPDYGRKGRRRR